MEKTLKRYFVIFTVPTIIAFAFAFIIPFAQGLYHRKKCKMGRT